jgi:hypothetical protein
MSLSETPTDQASAAAADSGQYKSPLEQALAELASLVGSAADSKAFEITRDQVYYLLLLWAPFHVYPIKPYPADFTAGAEPRIQTLASGWKLIVYNDSVSASPGENYGSYCTGPLIAAAEEMVRMMAEKGVKNVALLGHQIAKRAAWMECFERNMEVANFGPSSDELAIITRIRQLRAEARKESAKAALTATEQRPE